VQIAYDANGVATIRCVVDTPPSTVPEDGINNSCGTAVSLGVIVDGQTVTRQGTTSPAGTADWFQASFANGPLQVTLTADPGITFDISGRAERHSRQRNLHTIWAEPVPDSGGRRHGRDRV
jgi:hypothetical protein